MIGQNNKNSLRIGKVFTFAIFEIKSMKQQLFTTVLLLLTAYVFAQIPAGYYDGTTGLTGNTLKSALNNIIDGHTELSYAAVKEALKNTDEDTLNANNIICLYSGWSYAKTEFGNGSIQEV